MSRSRQYLVSLLDSVPITELSDFEQRSAFDQIRGRIAEAEDIIGELKILYRVNNFSDFALSLLWIAESVERDPTRLEPLPEEQTLALSAFRRAIEHDGGTYEAPAVEVPAEPIVEAPTETPLEALAEPTMETPSGFGPEPTTEAFGGFPSEPAGETPSPFGIPAEPEPAAEMLSGFGPVVDSTPESPSEAGVDAFSGFGAGEAAAEFPSAPTPEPLSEEPMAGFPSDFPTLEQPAEMPPTASPAPTEPVPPGAVMEAGEFAKLIEQFVESVQTGAENRDAVKDQVLSACAAVLAEGSGAPDDYRAFSQIFTEFIHYIVENQYIDDIRVMNLLSNVTDPVWAWARADELSRLGMLDAAYDVLRDFKSLFE